MFLILFEDVCLEYYMSVRFSKGMRSYKIREYARNGEMRKRKEEDQY